MELSELQKKIIRETEGHCVVIASAAAGKTATMTEKVRALLKNGVNSSDIAVITFTRMAAGELKNRLGEDYKDGMFVGTIHALAYMLLRAHGISAEREIAAEDFDALFELVLANPQCHRQFEWVIMDEAQDSTQQQFEFVIDFLDPRNWLLTGDLRQSIYGFREARPDILKRIMKDEDVKVFDLNENYRNGYNILKFAKRIIEPTGLVDTSVAMRQYNGIVIQDVFSYATIKRLINTSPDSYGDWAILHRTNAGVDAIYDYLRRQGIPADTFKQGDLTNEELAARVKANNVKVLTIHASKGLEFKNVVVAGFRFHPDDERMVNYVAATRARDQLVWLESQKVNKQRFTNWVK